MLRRWVFVVTLVMACELGVCASCQAAGILDKSLKGLKAVKVFVEPLKPEIEELGLSKIQLQTDTELSLRRSGIKVSNEASALLYLNVNCTNRPPIELYGCCLRLQLEEGVFLARDPSVGAVAVTWEVGNVSTVGKAYIQSHVRTAVAHMVNQFINAYLEQNPHQ